MPVPLRNFGPRVFISYSFRDAAFAQQLDRALSARGLQVRREDETSLINLRLADAIPLRIADAEVMIQLLTEASSASEWVAREFAFALEARERNPDFVILPIVLGSPAIPPAVREWWYLNIEPEGPSAATLDQIEKICLRAVHLLRLDANDPFAFDRDDAHALLASPASSRRLIVDADGRLLEWTDDTLEFFRHRDDPYRDKFLAQESNRRARLVRRYRVLDEVVRKLARELMREVTSYSLPEEHIADALVPLQRFARIVIGDDIMRAADVAPPAPHPLRTQYATLVEAAQAANKGNHSPGFCNPGFYAWAFGVEGGEDAMADMGMDAPGFDSVRVVLPRCVFGRMADAYTRNAVPFSPRSELLSDRFINFVLPQIAVEAAYNLVDPQTARRDLEARYAWKLEHYGNMGLR